MRREARLTLAGGASGAELADWAEGVVVIEARRRISRAELRGRMRLVAEDDAETQIDLMLSEVERRRALLGDAYPFTTDDAGLVRAPGTAASLYDLLLLLAVSPDFRTRRAFAEPDLMFDRVVQQALRMHLGHSAVGVRFAFPSSDGRPKGFPHAVKWLAERMGLAIGAGTPMPQSKDGGVDVVAWRPFGDRRSGFIVILAQATLQLDWQNKAKDVVRDRWRGWIDLGVDPVTVLAVPHVIAPGYAGWDQLRRTVALVLDRVRLVELIGTAALDHGPAAQTWVESERAALLGMSRPATPGV
jgi:hypothetical protein